MQALPAAGDAIAGYRLGRLLGRGGMGSVHEAVHEADGRVVALKLLLAGLATDDVFRARFEREARITSALDHPHIVRVHETGAADGLLFIAMDLIDGTDLAGLVAGSGPLHPAHAVDLLGQLADGLDSAADAGLVHRDIKPGNVLLATAGDGVHAYLSDFGLGKQATSMSGLTRTGHFVGTLDYAAPEQVESGAVDRRSDVYSLAAVLYEMLTAQRPFPVAREIDKLMAVLSQPPPRPSDLGAPAAFDAVIATALAKDPAGRFATAADLAAAATAAAGDAGPAPGPLVLATAPPDVDRDAPTAG